MNRNSQVNAQNEYFIMNEIVNNENISQRDLSKKLNISLGTINLLINKMIKDGLIKMEQVSSKQVIYMLTPQGIINKSKKTVNYLKSHYKVICDTKKRIKVILENTTNKYNKLFILKSNNEMGDILLTATKEFIKENKTTNIYIVNDVFALDEEQKQEDTVLIHIIDDYELIKDLKDKYEIKLLNILEII